MVGAVGRDVLIAFLIIANAIILFLCLIAGFGMQSIRSISGDSIAEAFYNNFGTFVIATGIFFSFLLAGITYLVSKK